MAPAMYVYFFCDATVENVPLIIVLLLLSMVLSIGISLVFALVFYVMLDNENVSVIHCFKIAVSLMKGNIGRLFRIYLSFIGMWILVMLSCGIGYLWFEPYRIQTYTLFYLDITHEKEMG